MIGETIDGRGAFIAPEEAAGRERTALTALDLHPVTLLLPYLDVHEDVGGGAIGGSRVMEWERAGQK